MAGDEEKDEKKEAAEAKGLALVNGEMEPEGRPVRRRVPLEYREYIEIPDDMEEGGTFSLLHYLSVLLKKRWLIIGGTLLLCLAAFIYTKMQTPVYRAMASFVPARVQNMSSRIDASFGVRSQVTDQFTESLYLVETYVRVMSGTNFLERIVDKPFTVPGDSKAITLTEYYGQDGATEEERRYKTIDLVMSNLKVNPPRQITGRNQPMIITIQYDASTPRFAASVVNLMLDELVLYNQTMQNTTTVGNREFIEKQLEAAKQGLDKAEKDRSDFERSNTKIVTPGLQVELDRLKRNVRIQEDVFMNLNRQVELVKIQEQENKASIDIFQRAIPPRFRTSPSTKKNVLIAGFLGLFMFCGLALAMDFVKKIDVKNEKSKELVESFAEVKGDVVKVGRLFGIRKRTGGSSKPALRK